MLKDIREGAQNMASALAEDGSPLAKSPQDLFENALVTGRDELTEAFIESRGGRENLSPDDRKLLENIDSVVTWIRHNQGEA